MCVFFLFDSNANKIIIICNVTLDLGITVNYKENDEWTMINPNVYKYIFKNVKKSVCLSWIYNIVVHIFKKVISILWNT